jgi:hypothetical protein
MHSAGNFDALALEKMATRKEYLQQETISRGKFTLNKYNVTTIRMDKCIAFHERALVVWTYPNLVAVNRSPRCKIAN